MAEEKKEPWLNYLALTTVVLAVCATLSTFKGGGYSTRSVISQAQASDQWAFFQAKSIRENMYRLQKENLVLAEDVLPANAAAAVALVTPGTTSTGTPASRQASTSSLPRPSTKESPPLRRTTRCPARARSTSSALMSACSAA